MANAWLLKPLPIVSATAASTVIGAPANVGLDYAGIVWRSDVGDADAITIDLGTDVAVDTVMAFGLAGGFSPSATVAVQLATTAQGAGFSGANTGTGTGSGNYWGVSQALLAGAVMPTSGKGVMAWSAPVTGGPPAAVRYLRLLFTGLGASGAIEISRVVAGARIQLARNFGFGGNFGVRDLGDLSFSPRGVMLRRRAAKLRTLALTFSNASKDEIEGQIKPLLEYLGNTEAVALLTDPVPHEQRQNRAYFGPLVGDLGTAWRNAAAWEAKINLVSLF